MQKKRLGVQVKDKITFAVEIGTPGVSIQID